MSSQPDSPHNRSNETYATNDYNRHVENDVVSPNITPEKPGPNRLQIPPLSPEMIARFWSLVDKRGPTACWLWLGSKARANKDSQFYGVWSVSIGGEEFRLRCHRVAWTLANGPIPDGLDLDHVYEKCASTLCCNPDHLEPVTVRVNVQRYYLSRTHCKRGHEIVEHGRACNACKTLGKQRERARKGLTVPVDSPYYAEYVATLSVSL